MADAELKLTLTIGTSAAVALLEQNRVMREALQRIYRWHGEFPETGQFWDEEQTRPMSYAASYGSNGERDFMRNVAKSAIDVAPQLGWIYEDELPDGYPYEAMFRFSKVDGVRMFPDVSLSELAP